jgi:crotonobetainyl-CoA:carnitine CoA-transferase CaiB-like acyl-CoA transferase
MFLDAGIPSATVIPSRDIAANPQLRHRRLFEVEHHPVTGDHEVPTLPFRYSRVDHWLRSPAPTLGRDNDSVLEDLGYSHAERQRLFEAGHIGAVPMGM